MRAVWSWMNGVRSSERNGRVGFVPFVDEAPIRRVSEEGRKGRVWATTCEAL